METPMREEVDETIKVLCKELRESLGMSSFHTELTKALAELVRARASLN